MLKVIYVFRIPELELFNAVEHLKSRKKTLGPYAESNYRSPFPPNPDPCCQIPLSNLLAFHPQGGER